MSKLLAPHPSWIGGPEGPERADAVPPELVHGSPHKLRDDLVALLGEDRVLHRLIDVVRYASDASQYRMIPQIVVMPRSVGEILAYCRQERRHATFRAAGASLNGQFQSDDILIDGPNRSAGHKRYRRIKQLQDRK